MKGSHDKAFVEIYRPKNPTELTLVKSMLETEGIEFYVNNEEFSNLFRLPSSKGFAEATLMVPAEDADKVRKILSDLGVLEG